MMRSRTPSTNWVGVRASLNAPKPPRPASTTSPSTSGSHRMRVSARSSASNAGADGGEDRKCSGQTDDRNRQQPTESRRVDEKSKADPIQAGKKIAEAEPPSRD